MFILYNKKLQIFLKYPRDKVWASENIQEAQTLLESAQQYVKAAGLPEMADKLTIVEISEKTIDGIPIQSFDSF